MLLKTKAWKKNYEKTKNKIEKDYTKMEAEEQTEFRGERSTVDHMFTLTQITEKNSS